MSSERSDGRTTPDILLDSRGRRPRFSRLRWLAGGFLAGKFGLAVLVIFLLVGGVWLVYNRYFSMAADVGVVAVSGAKHPEAGRGLTASEAGAVARFGEPMHLGDSGRPVVKLDSTGEVRELTPVELEFPAGKLAEERGDGVLWSPGRLGWGIWWDGEDAADAARKHLYMDRVGWVARQNAEIAQALAGLENGMVGLAAMDLESWKVGQGERLSVYMDSFVAAYPDASPGYWGALGWKWMCDETLETELRHGVTEGCPSDDVSGAISLVWTEIGVMAELMRGFAAIAAVRDIQTAKQAMTANTSNEMRLALDDLLSVRERLPGALALLDMVSEREGLLMRHSFLEGY